MNDASPSALPATHKTPLACVRGFVALIAVWSGGLSALSVLACAPSALAPLVATSPLGTFFQTPLSPIALAALAAAIGGIGALLGAGAALFLRRRAIHRLRARATRRLDVEAQKRGEERRQRTLRIEDERVDESETIGQRPPPDASVEAQAIGKAVPENAPAAPIDDATACDIIGQERDESPEGEEATPSGKPETPAEPSRAILALRSRECDQLSLLQLTERCAIALSRSDCAARPRKPARQRFANRLRQLDGHPGLGAQKGADGADRHLRSGQDIPLARRVQSSEMRLQNALRALERLSARG